MEADNLASSPVGLGSNGHVFVERGDAQRLGNSGSLSGVPLDEEVLYPAAPLGEGQLYLSP